MHQEDQTLDAGTASGAFKAPYDECAGDKMDIGTQPAMEGVPTPKEVQHPRDWSR